MWHQQCYGWTEDDVTYRDEDSDSSEDSGNVEIEVDIPSNIDSDEEFLVFYDA